MAYVVTELCFDCRHTSCVSVCPVDCFHADEDRLWIDPVECIDCGACVPECPEEAIFPLASVPEKYQKDINLNLENSMRFPIIIDTCIPTSIKPHCKGNQIEET